MHNHSAIKGKLYGVGIGPGESKLLTLKAKEVLNKVQTIFAPKGNEDGVSIAKTIIKETCSKKNNFIELIFPMTKDKNILKKFWQEAAAKVAQTIKKEKETAFVTIGDPLIYSTYIYLLKTLREIFPNIQTETIPGINSFSAAACRIQLPLLEANQKMAVLAVSKNLDSLEEAFKNFDTVVLMKVGSKLDKVIKLLRKINLIKNAVLISRAGQPDEKIVRDLSSLEDKKLGYLSVVIVKKNPRV